MKKKLIVECDYC